MKRTCLLIGIITTFLLSWEVVCRMSSEQLALVLPAPSAILQRLWERPDRFAHHAAATFTEMAAGLLLAGSAALPVAWLMSRYTAGGSALQSLFVMVQCIPMFTLAPIMILWFGWSAWAIILPTALMLFFPLVITLYHGLKSVPQVWRDYFHLHDATKFQVFTKLELPFAKPHLLAGLRIAAAGAGIGAVAAEWAGAQDGLGVLMLESRRATDLQTTFGALFCLAALSLCFYAAVAYKRFAVPAVCLFLVFMPQAASPTKSLTLSLDWLPNPNHVPLYVGIEEGYFEEAGLPLRIVKMQDPSGTLGYVATGQIDVGVFYTPDTLRAIEQQIPVEIAAALIPQPLNSIIFRRSEDVIKPMDLKDKVLGYCVDGSHRNFMTALLDTQGLHNMPTYNASFDLVSTLASGRVDALYGAYWNIECEHLAEVGVKTSFFPLSDFGCPSHPELVLITKSGAATDLRERLQAAIEKSLQYCKNNPEKAFATYVKANPDKDASTLAWEARAWARTWPLLTTSALDNKEIIAFHAWMKSHNLLE